MGVNFEVITRLLYLINDIFQLVVIWFLSGLRTRYAN